MQTNGFNNLARAGLKQGAEGSALWLILWLSSPEVDMGFTVKKKGQQKRLLVQMKGKLMTEQQIREKFGLAQNTVVENTWLYTSGKLKKEGFCWRVGA